MKKILTDIERFWRHVEHQENGCWLWTAAVVKGYPVFKIGSHTDGTRKMVKAYRFIWEQTSGPLSPDVDIHHVCNNPLCVNPEHLEKVTRKEHMLKSPNNITYAFFHQTHCVNGHELTPDNVYIWRGWRHCRQCVRTAGRKHDAKRGWRRKTS